WDIWLCFIIWFSINPFRVVFVAIGVWVVTTAAGLVSVPDLLL
ncbi:hypothetical protein A2U01_0078023, partial [Trifolium medium]|nr:hypothetical protein [Trifolium medium]